MANVDYVVTLGAALPDVIAMVTSATDARPAGRNHLHTSDVRAELSVYPSGREVVAEVYYAGDLAHRRQLSQRISQ